MHTGYASLNAWADNQIVLTDLAVVYDLLDRPADRDEIATRWLNREKGLPRVRVAQTERRLEDLDDVRRWFASAPRPVVASTASST